MPVRTSEATWRGGIQEGDGETALGSGVWQGDYSYRSRFREDEPAKSNPEELLAAGHASCFAMALANRLEQAGYEPDRIHATAECDLEMVESEGPTITGIHLDVEATVDGIDETEFLDVATAAKEGCPVSRALAGTDITMDASL